MICHRLPTSGANGLDMTKRGGKGKVISIIPTNYISRVSDMSFFLFFFFAHLMKSWRPSAGAFDECVNSG